MVKNSKYSSSMHNARMRTLVDASATGAKKVVLLVILLVSLVVVVALLMLFVFDRENQVKSRISGMVTDYYENYYYDKLAESAVFQDKANLDANMQKFHERGFAPITLRDLLYYDNKRNYEYYDYLTNYCDENNTVARIYIDSPYERNSYHYDITYSCNF